MLKKKKLCLVSCLSTWGQLFQANLVLWLLSLLCLTFAAAPFNPSCLQIQKRVSPRHQEDVKRARQ